MNEVKEPVILAFMQNAWFPPGTSERIIDKYHDDPKFHARVLARTMSGKRLVKALGHKIFNKIIWDNSTRATSSVAAGSKPADEEHMKRRVRIINPDLVILIGGTANKAWHNIRSDIEYEKSYIHWDHPNRRGITNDEMDEWRQQVLEFMDIFTVEKYDE